MSDVTPNETETSTDTDDTSTGTDVDTEAEAAVVEAATEPAATTAESAPAATPTIESTEGALRGNRRKVREGLVSSSTMQKTVVVDVIERVRHPRYAKTVQRTKHFYAHDEGNEVRVGDRVRIQETRPMSKLKRWRVVEVLERAR
jgi:small subunit ribosomal protein S17